MTARDSEAEAQLIRLLASYHVQDGIDLAIVEMAPIDDFGDAIESFEQAVHRLGLGAVNSCLPMCDDDAGVFDKCAPRTEVGIGLQHRIHQTLFPNRVFDLDDARKRYGVVERDRKKFRQKWVESRRSVQTVWAHIMSGRDVFVTNNQNYFKWKKRPLLRAIGINSIARLEVFAERFS
jgi:hypothetical protein